MSAPSSDSSILDSGAAASVAPVAPLVTPKPGFGGADGGPGIPSDGGGGGGGRAIPTPGINIPREKFAMWVFLGSLVMLFAGMMSAYTVLKAGAAAWPPPGMPALPATLWVSTLLIVASSITFQLAHVSVRRGRTGLMKVGLVATTLLGSAFLASQWMIWQSMMGAGVEIASNTYAAIFYTLTGLHALHVVAGVLYLLVTTGKALLGRYGPERHLGVELCGMYWHFVDLVWIALFSVLYFQQ